MLTFIELRKEYEHLSALNKGGGPPQAVVGCC